MSKGRGALPGLSAIVREPQGMLAEVLNVLVPVAPALAWVKSCSTPPRTLPLPELKTVARCVVPAGGVIVKEPPELSALKSMSTFVLLIVVVILAALSLVPVLAPAL